MVEFQVVNSKTINFGNNKFIEVARKIAKSETGETEFISISKGNYFEMDQNQKRYRKGLGFTSEIKESVIEALKAI